MSLLKAGRSPTSTGTAHLRRWRHFADPIPTEPADKLQCCIRRIRQLISCTLKPYYTPGIVIEQRHSGGQRETTSPYMFWQEIVSCMKEYQNP